MILDLAPTTKKRRAAKISMRRNQFTTDGDAFAILCQHAISHLPDSIAGRQAVLAALLLQAPRTSPLLPHLREIQWHLNTHLALARDPLPNHAAQPQPSKADECDS
jgi:hypothetical protein